MKYFITFGETDVKANTLYRVSPLMIRYYRLLILIFIVCESSVCNACGLTNLLAFERKAQILDDNAFRIGESLLQCINERREAFHWLFILSKIKAKYNDPTYVKKIGSLQFKILRTNKVPMKKSIEDEIDEAYAGNWIQLKRKIDDGSPSFSGQSEPLLAIARALIREEYYQDSRAYYIAALRIIGDSPRIEMELLYTYIVQGDFDGFRRQGVQFNAPGSTQPLRDGIARGHEAIKKLESLITDQSSASQKISFKDGELSALIEGYLISREYKRITGKIEYHDVFDLTFAHHRLEKFVFDQSEERRDVLRVGKDGFQIGSVLMGGHIAGRANVTKTPILFDGYIGYQSKHSGTYKAGFKQHSLFEDTPLTRQSLDLVQDSAYLTMNIRDIFFLSCEISRDKDRTDFYRSGVKYKKQFRPNNSDVSDLLGYVALNYELRPFPSPDYESYHQLISTLFALVINKEMMADSKIEGKIGYINMQKFGFGGKDRIQNSGIVTTLGVQEKLNSTLMASANISYNGDETLRPTQAFQNRLLISFGVNYYQ